MISQESIIEALHNNNCPACRRAYHMYATYQKVSCGFCGVSWELTKEAFETGVRIKDTRTWKEENGYA